MLLVSVSLTVGCIIMGILLVNGKGVKHFNWFTAMPKKVRDRIDIKAFGKCMGKFMFSLAFCAALLIASDIMKLGWLSNVGLALSFVTIIYAYLYVGSGERFIQH